MYCGEVVEISQPLFPIGMKTPMSISRSSDNTGLAQRSKPRAISRQEWIAA